MHPRIGLNIADRSETVWDIQMNNCGFYRNVTEELRSNRPMGRPDHHIIFVVRGELKVWINGSEQLAKEDEMVYFPPDTRQKYVYQPGEDTLYYWIHFSGTKLERLLRLFPLEHRIYRLGRVAEHTAMIRDIIQKYEQGKPGADIYCHAQTQQLLTEIGRDTFALSRASRKAARAEQIAAFIRSNPEDACSNEALAKRFGISEYHLIRVFKEEMGYAPGQYRKLVLVDRAKQLLSETDLNINEIAYMLGFSDPLYFSRLFRHSTGVSPSAYREASE